MVVVIKLRANDTVRLTITSGVSMSVQRARRTQPTLLAMIAGWPTARHSVRVQAEALGQTVGVSALSEGVITNRLIPAVRATISPPATRVASVRLVSPRVHRRPQARAPQTFA
jgi:hypothetical protein